MRARAEAHRRARRRRRALAAAAVLALVLFGTPPWEYVGSDGFDLSLDPAADRGPQSASNRRGDYAITLGGGEDDAGRVARAEEMTARLAAKEYELARVTGVTFEGRTRLQATVLCRTSWGVQRMSTRPESPANDPESEAQSEARSRFNTARFRELYRTVRQGDARLLAPVDVMVDGRTVTMERWLVQDPDYGPVIYWDSGLTR